MSYNSELQSNNADLRAILDAVNNLPESSATAAAFVMEMGEADALEVVNSEFYEALSEDDKIEIDCLYSIDIQAWGHFLSEQNYDGLLAALRAGKTVYFKYLPVFYEMGYRAPAVERVHAFHLTKIGLVVVCPYGMFLFPNGSAHNENTDPHRDTL